MHNPNIFSKVTWCGSILSGLLMFSMLTDSLLAEAPEEKKTEKAAPAEKQPTPEEKSDSQQVEEAKKVLSQSKNMLMELRSLNARLRETIVIGKRRFRVVGQYVQGAERKLKLTLEVKIGDSDDPLTGSLLQVCDGQILWSRYNIGDQIRLTRRDVGQILKAVEESDAIPQNLLIAELGLGGIPTLLSSIQQNAIFHKSEIKKIDEREYHVIEGTWSEEFLKKFGTGGQPAKKLPAHVPDKIRIYFDEKTLFPRRILYLKKDNKKEVYLPMVMLDFMEVVLNSPVNEEDFNFVPGDNENPVDITATYLSKLKLPQKK